MPIQTVRPSLHNKSSLHNQPSLHKKVAPLLPSAAFASAGPPSREAALPGSSLSFSTGQGEQRGLRLTRRGRLVFIGLPLMLTAAAALTVLGFFTAPAMASSGGPEVTQTVQVSVAAGESLWALAQEFAPERDPRDVIADIMELNNLTEAQIPVGAQLYIPVQS